MKVLLALTAFALILTAACSTGDAATTCANPDGPTKPAVSPVAEVPEGTLLLAKELPQSLLTLNSKCGETTSLPNAEQAWPAPDGSKATVILSTGGIALIDRDGLLTLAEWDRNAGFWPAVAWSRDAQRLAFNRPASAEEPAGVWTWDGRESRRVYTSGNAWPIGFTSGGDVVLSPSAKRLKVVDSNGKEVQSIEMPFDAFSEGYVMSPDGENLAVMSGSEGGMNEPPHSTGLWLYNFGSEEWTRLAEMNASVSSSPGAGLFVSANAMAAAKARKGTPPPSWSADGQRLTYYRVYTDAEVYHAELWLHDLRSNDDQMLSETGWSDGWSPDGKYLAFQKSNPEAIGLVGPDGEIEVLGRDNGFVGTFAWSPDGRLIVSTGHDLRLYDPETRETVTLEYSGKPIGGIPVHSGGVHASPSGRYFAVATGFGAGGNGFSYGNVTPGVYIIDTTTGEVTRVIDEGGVYVSGWVSE